MNKFLSGAALKVAAIITSMFMLVMMIAFMPGSVTTSYAEGNKTDAGVTRNDPETVPVTSVRIQEKSEGVLKAVVTGKDGKTPTNVTYQWQKCTDDYYDELEDEMVTEYEDMTGENGETLTITNSNKSRFNKYKVIVRGDQNSYKESPDFEYSKVAPESGDAKILSDVIEKCGGFTPLRPVFGTDTNAKAAMETLIRSKGFDGVNVQIVGITKKSYPNGGTVANIEAGGDLTYFYHDPFKIAGAPINNATYARFAVKFKISKGDSSKQFEKQVDLYWDADKLVSTLKTEALDKVTFDEIKGTNSDQQAVTENLSLLRYFGGQNSTMKNTQIMWKSSDESAIEIQQPQGGAGNIMFDPLIGKVKRGAEDKEVTLTATLKYTGIDTNGYDKLAGERIASMKKEIKVIVKAREKTAAEQLQSELQEKLDKAMSEHGLVDPYTGDKVDTGHITGNFDFPSTRDIGVDGKYQPVTIKSSGEDVIKDQGVNAPRVLVYQPLPGQMAKDVLLTITVTDKATGVSASANVNVTVDPIKQADLDAAKAFMDKAVAGYWDGIKGSNTDPKSVTGNMHSFQEVNYDANTGLSFVYNIDDRTYRGVSADARVAKEDQIPASAGGSDSQYIRFFSSNENIISHENLLLNKVPEHDTNVTVDSYLSHEIYAKYYEMYKARGDRDSMEIFAPLYRRHAVCDITVKGKKTEGGGTVDEPGDGNISASASGKIILAKAVYKRKLCAKISWSSVRGATKYVIYYNKVGRRGWKKLASVKSSSKSYTKRKLKMLARYRFRVKAMKGKKTLATSKTMYTLNGYYTRKLTNAKSITPTKKTLNVRVGRAVTLKAKVKLVKNKRKLVNGVSKVRYMSSNKNIASVNSAGRIAGKKAGSCRIYVIAHNGIWSSCKVTVK